ncbi:putative nucleotidyltransferase with HDIG domain [Methylopila jiangsuensis]|uniref:HD-GYP domain-containing protein n=1 Tax=Methylopila jiangsuensis TaxID=586230 RepID=UPI0022F2E3E6|nr:HD domain-containing phosphohydrolase [Methylopila jiangsuensis]MDR6285550.1 putative nucleotidyltransferase with HDIG domain [Methylopila jiangsuensis]
MTHSLWRLRSGPLPQEASAPQAVFTDVAFDNEAAVHWLRRTLQALKRNDIPVVCLLRSEDRREEVQAYALGATSVLPADASDEDILKAIDALKRRADIDLAVEPVRARIVQASSSFDHIMTAGRAGDAPCSQTLSDHANGVLAAVRQDGVKAWLHALRSYNDVTYQHCLTVTGLAAAFASRLGFGARDRLRLTRAAALHDIGKARIPLAILDKPGALTPAEWAVMRSHPLIGYDLLASRDGFCAEELAVVRSHHEMLDGSGYPDGLSGREIGDLVRLLTICDIYAALITPRPYKDGMPAADAYDIMVRMGGKLDGDMLAEFRHIRDDLAFDVTG